jgi:hypothetical protein
VLVRTDLPLAHQIVQVGHACLEAGRQFAQPTQPRNLVVLGVDSELQLRATIEHAASLGIHFAAFHEPDDAMGLTAACSEPVTGIARRAFRRMSLWRIDTALPNARAPPDVALIILLS